MPTWCTFTQYLTGKTPIQAFIDSKHLALEKQLDRTMPKGEQQISAML